MKDNHVPTFHYALFYFQQRYPERNDLLSKGLLFSFKTNFLLLLSQKKKKKERGRERWVVDGGGSVGLMPPLPNPPIASLNAATR